MRMALLITEAMKPIPKAIKVLDNWGHVAIYIKGGHTAGGDHMHVEGDEEVIINWLRPFDGIWRTKPGTSPVFQQFEAVHIAGESV